MEEPDASIYSKFQIMLVGTQTTGTCLFLDSHTSFLGPLHTGYTMQTWSPQLTAPRQDHGLSNGQEELGVMISPCGGSGSFGEHPMLGLELAQLQPWLGTSPFTAITQSSFSPAGLLQLRGAQEVWITPVKKTNSSWLQLAGATGHRGRILLWGRQARWPRGLQQDYWSKGGSSLLQQIPILLVCVIFDSHPQPKSLSAGDLYMG